MSRVTLSVAQREVIAQFADYSLEYPQLKRVR